MTVSRLSSFRASFLAVLAVACTAPSDAPPRPPVEAPTTLAALEAPAPAPAPALPAIEGLEQRLDRVARALDAEREELHIPGLALAIVHGDETIFARGFGLADVEAQRAVTPETIFAIGSSTKAFTATLVGMLADEEKLAYEDPITKALPWFVLPVDAPEGERTVTLRDLLAHRTGFARMDILWAAAAVDRDVVLHTALKAEPFAPFREEFHYNNIMFLAAGEACEAVTGKSWEELVRARILEPLGMKDSTLSVAEAQRDPRLALGYMWKEERKTFEHLPMRVLDAIAPAGSINSNVLDMTRWIRFQLRNGEFAGKRLISAERLAETRAPENELGPGTSYGLGWFLRDWKGQKMVEHGGNIDGFAAEVVFLPEARLGVVMLANVSATPLQGTIGPKVFEALLGPLEEEGKASEEDLARYLGVYIANFFQFKEAEFTVQLKDGKLAIDIPGQTLFELGPPGEDGKRPFVLTDQIAVSFVEDESGAVTDVVIHQAGFTFECPRQGLTRPPEIPLTELERYLGDYLDPANGKTFSLVVAHDRLAIDYPEQMVYELRPPDAEGKWVCRVIDQLGIEFTDSTGAIESLTFHERGSERLCPRVGAEAVVAPPPLADLLRLRGVEAFERTLTELGTCKLSGTMRFVHCGIEGKTSVVFDASGRFREETDLSPFAKTRSSFDGEHAWYDSTLQEFQELEGKSRDQALLASPAVFFGDWSARFDRAEVVRASKSDGQELVIVELQKGEAPAVVLHVDAKSGDVVRAEVLEIIEGVGTLPKKTSFEDWRDFDGLRLPARVISEDDATGRVVIEFTELETRLPTDPALFTLTPELYER